MQNLKDFPLLGDVCLGRWPKSEAFINNILVLLKLLAVILKGLYLAQPIVLVGFQVYIVFFVENFVHDMVLNKDLGSRPAEMHLWI